MRSEYAIKEKFESFIILDPGVLQIFVFENANEGPRTFTNNRCMRLCIQGRHPLLKTFVHFVQDYMLTFLEISAGNDKILCTISLTL